MGDIIDEKGAVLAFFDADGNELGRKSLANTETIILPRGTVRIQLLGTWEQQTIWGDRK